jgi:predicted molibdopterin-dependent oxidoreductase YjgC
MFQRLSDPMRKPVRFRFEDQEIEAREGDSVAAALLAAGIGSLKDAPVSGTARGPYCMMGVCFECLVEIDGAGHQQACLAPVRAGMEVRRQPAARDIGVPVGGDGR